MLLVETIGWLVSRRDLKLWLGEAYPVILVVYDGKKDRAFWAHIQIYFSDRPTAELFPRGESTSIHISTGNRFNRRAIQGLAKTKNEIHTRLRGKGQ